MILVFCTTIKMRKIIYIFIAVVMIAVMASCGSSKGVTYMTNIDSISLTPSKGLYDAKIMPKDLLTIGVYTVNPNASAPFNIDGQQGTGSATTSTTKGGYLVSNDGFITFPIVGKVHVAGLTKNECEDLLKSKVQPYLARTENPVITVKMDSYHVTVTGEVGKPSVIPVAIEKINIMEALTQAGDLTLYGRRDNILLIREDATGEKHSVRLNLNDANLINSPYYYLQQNDIVYVEPNKAKAKGSNQGPTSKEWMTYTGFGLGLVTAIIALLR